MRGLVHPRVRAGMHTLSRAEANGQLLNVRCGHCSIRHLYRPGDIAQLVGDVPLLDLEGRFKCSKCASKDAIDIRFVLPTAAERMGMTVRHLVKVKNVRVPVWKDVRG